MWNIIHSLFQVFINSPPYVHYICVVLVILSLLKILSRLSPEIKRARPGLWIPGYDLIYTDIKDSDRKEGVRYSDMLRSSTYQLQGKPDYIFANSRGNLLPVELKSGTIGNRQAPYEGDLLQLAAYFLIIEDVYGSKPRRGRLIYKDCMFIIKNSRRLQARLLSTISDMRDMLVSGEQEASPSFTKCKHCICRGTVCEFYE